METRSIVGAIDDLAPLILGRDPRDIEQCFQILTRHGFWRMGVIGMSAISGIEMALWDIFGKSLNVPVWRLLGGKVREMYALTPTLGWVTWGLSMRPRGAPSFPNVAGLWLRRAMMR